MDNLILLLIILGAIYLFKRLAFDIKRKGRRNYYRNVYLKSDAWQRKRYVVLKRDNWQCVYFNKAWIRITTLVVTFALLISILLAL
jgi:hypothetical protein